MPPPACIPEVAGTLQAIRPPRETPMSNHRAADEAAIQAVLADSYKAWEAGDADAMVANYSADATAIMTGSLRDGREVIRQNMALAFAGPLAGSSTYNKQLSVRFIGEDAAIVISESAILFAGETEVPTDERKVNATWVLQKRNHQWLIAAYHNSPVLAPSQ
ncbi:SgcJ/EcaC family oxidoreductase [Nocardia sp. NPDC051900]|uniref:SgcJ/EcaC family oxidoreductase n=2 Tax=unclassified Nocardia TaxID=2637762 RepID=UPI0037A73FB6